MAQPVDNVQFVSPSIGDSLTVYLSKSSGDVNTDKIKYLDIQKCKKVQIRSNKVFKVTKINGNELTDPITSGTTNPEFRLDVSATSIWIESIEFQVEEADGEFQVMGIGGIGAW